ncbi:unnamed protein product [Linum tenue]|uniref:Uncharacterized protein n=1 Tax=Linum tenue TaxID=586396 RepID=A0AAV0RJC6_9ROSI|nr:unnamed protein product [Linum tenue]
MLTEMYCYTPEAGSVWAGVGWGLFGIRRVFGGSVGMELGRWPVLWLCKWLRARSEYLRCGAFKRWESCRFRRLREKGGMGEERFVHRLSQEQKDPSFASELILPSAVNLLW